MAGKEGLVAAVPFVAGKEGLVAAVPFVAGLVEG